MNPKKTSLIDRTIRFCLENKLIVSLVLLALISWGILVAPFDWKLEFLPRDPVPVDAIPDIGENQQIVFTEWPGRGSDIMVPMAIPVFGGMTIQILTILVVPVLYSFVKESKYSS